MPIDKVLLMPNFPGWAFDHIAQGIKKHGSLDYDILYEKDYREYRGRDLPGQVWDDYDRIILFAPWMHWTNTPLDRTICIFHEAFEMDGYNTGQYYKAFVTSDISYEHIKDKSNVVKVQAGIDFDNFYPLDRKKHGRVVGWVGAYSGHVEKKGYEEFYKPLSEWFTLNPHTKEDDYIEGDYFQGIREYYASIDVLTCTSSWEGYPLGVLEASACGVPVVSTRVGIVPEIIPERQIVPRNVLMMRDALYKNPEPVDVSQWDWKIKIKEWEDALL